MGRGMRRRLVLALILGLAFGGATFAQSLSVQVLQLLQRANTWTGVQTFDPRGGLVLANGAPSNTANRIYRVANTLYFNGNVVASVAPGPDVPHVFLSAVHTDTVAAAAVRASVVVGNATPAWAISTPTVTGSVLRYNGTDSLWSLDASLLTALNATQLTSGTVPLARLVDITNTEIAAAAAIAWTKLSKTGSSLADLTTRSAGDLSSGTLLDARLSANVSLLGASIETGEITNGTILFADWGANGCINTQIPKYNGTAWVCAADASGSGTVTSVAATVPSILSLAGSPITTTGTLALTLATQTANTVFAGPTSGGAATPTFRAPVDNDIPDTITIAGTNNVTWASVNKTGSTLADLVTRAISDTTGTLGVTRGGTGLITVAGANLFLRSSAPDTWATSGILTADLPAGTTTDTSTSTFTNKTLNVESTGNILTTVERMFLRAAKCQNVTASTDWSLPASDPAAAACVTGTNTQKGVLDFADGGNALSAQQELRLPADFTGALDATFIWYTSAVAGAVVWQLQTICVADQETGDPAFNTASTVTDNAHGTTLQYNLASITGVTITGCAASESLYVKVSRDPAHASDTIAATARLVGLELTTRRAQ